jgi:hypothetical protein
MLELKLGGQDIKALMSRDGIFDLVADVEDLQKPFSPQRGQLVSLKFQTGPSREIKFGSADSVALGLSPQTDASVLLLWPSSSADQLKALETFGLEDYFARGAHAHQLLMVLTIGASADASAAGDFRYAALTAGATLKAGADGALSMVQAFPQETLAEDVLRDFFKGANLPADITVAPQPGEVTVLEYGGYLSLGGSLSLGYEISGCPSQQLKDLNISEYYKLGLSGKLDFLSKVAGRFRIEVGQGSRPGWARVKLRKSKDKNFQIAADVSMGGELSIQGFSDSADDFLGALLGLKAQNWLNLFDKIKNYTDLQQIETYLDDLARTYIEQLTGQAFARLESSDVLKKVIGTINKALDSYQNVGDYAVALFDRYYDPIAQKVDDEIVKVLEKIKSLTSLDQLRGSVLGKDLSHILYLLTGGRPLDWLLERVTIDGKVVGSLDALKQRADDVLSLIKDKVHQELRRIIALAKSKFPLDQFLSGLKQIDLNQLKSTADQKMVGFVERLIGKAVKGLSDSGLGKVVDEVHGIAAGVDKFKDTLYNKVKESLDQSLKVSLNIGYNRSKEDETLIDVELNLQEQQGRALLKAAGRGDFSTVLQDYDPSVVRLYSGVLTHQVSRQSSIAFNVVGWHKNFQYQSLTKLITRSEQHIKSEDNGLLTVTTDISLDTGTDKTRNGERIYTNMTLGFVGASKGVARFDPQTQRYLVDVITGMSGKYALLIEDQHTTPEELANYLDYAVDFGIRSTRQAAVQALTPLLSKAADGSYGSTALDYEVRFTEQGFDYLFTTDINKIPMRSIIRRLTLANYLNSGKNQIRDIGWCYWTPTVYNLWHQSPTAFINSSREFSPIAPSPIEHLPAPHQVVLQNWQLKVLDKLYFIEEALVGGLADLQQLINNQSGLSPLKYEEALSRLGKALDAYDSVDECANTFFALFDALIAASGQQAVRDSSLTLKSQLPGHPPTTKMLTPP